MKWVCSRARLTLGFCNPILECGWGGLSWSSWGGIRGGHGKLSALCFCLLVSFHLESSLTSCKWVDTGSGYFLGDSPSQAWIPTFFGVHLLDPSNKIKLEFYLAALRLICLRMLFTVQGWWNLWGKVKSWGYLGQGSSVERIFFFWCNCACLLSVKYETSLGHVHWYVHLYLWCTPKQHFILFFFQKFHWVGFAQTG